MKPDTILIFVLVTKNCFIQVRPPIGTYSVQLEIEMDLICTLSFNQLMTPHILNCRPLCVALNANPSSALLEVELPPVFRSWDNISTA